MDFSMLVDGKSVRLTGKLPLLPVRDVILFPGVSLPLFVGRPASVAAVKKAASGNQALFATAQRRPAVTVPRRVDLHEIGVSRDLRQVLSLPDGTMRVVVEGLQRGRLQKLYGEERLLEAEVVPLPEAGVRSASLPLLLRDVKSAFLDYAGRGSAHPGRRAPWHLRLREPSEAPTGCRTHLPVGPHARVAERRAGRAPGLISRIWRPMVERDSPRPEDRAEAAPRSRLAGEMPRSASSGMRRSAAA